MARTYSDDLRRKLVEAYAAGKGTQGELAERFGVSLGWVEKVFRQRRATGQIERVEQRHGPLSRVTPAVERCLREQLREVSDRTLSDLQQGLWERERVRLSVVQLWRVLKRMKLRLKKSHSTPPNRTAKKAASAAGRGGNR